MLLAARSAANVTGRSSGSSNTRVVMTTYLRLSTD